MNAAARRDSACLSTEERALFERAAQWRESSDLLSLTTEVITGIVANHESDFATALLYDRLRRSRNYEPLFAHMGATDETIAKVAPVRDIIVAVVPGAFYQQVPTTGADGRVVLEAVQRLGFRAERIPVASFGAPNENAGIIGDWIERHSGQRVILVSLSKGGADVKALLADARGESIVRSVKAWIDLSGILEGTALANWILSRRLRSKLAKLLFWWHGLRYDVLHEMKRGPGCPLDAPLNLPEGMRVVHVIGFPLVRHLSSRLARRAHRRLLPLGPSDGGGILLADACRRPGLLYPVWGQDHYLRSVNVERFVGRLLAYVLDDCAWSERMPHENPVAVARG